MKKAIRRPAKDERDEQIEVRSKYHALTFVVAFTQVLTHQRKPRLAGQLIHPVFRRGGSAVL